MSLRIPQQSYNAYSKDSWKLTDSFDTSYWSGLEVAVFANDILLDEHIQTTYQIVEKVVPYYGYHSYVANRLHHGTRIIAGEININFKRHGYLFSLLNLLKTKGTTVLPGTTPTGKQTALVTDVTNSSENLANLGQNASGDALRNLVDSIKRKNVVLPYTSSADIATRQGLFETSPGGFDLTLIFGSTLDSKRRLQYVRDNEYIADGYVEENEDGISTNNIATGFRLAGVSITGLSKTIDDSGRPIVETYSFQARDVRVLESAAIKGTLAHKQKQSASSTGPLGLFRDLG